MTVEAELKKIAKGATPVRLSSALAMQNLHEAGGLVLRGVFLNSTMAVVKILSGVLGSSYALIADGIESLLDVAGSVVTWRGVRLAATPPDVGHPYGHGKAEPLAAILISVFVFFAAILIALLSIREMFVRQHTPPAAWTLIVLIVVILVKEIIFQVMSHRGKKLGSSALIADAFHHRSDAITSIAAFIGISVALIAGPGYENADDWAALFASGFIGYTAIQRMRPAINEIMDSAPDPEIEAGAREAAESVPGVIGLDESRMRKMGLEYFMDLHLIVDGNISVHEGHRIAHEVKDAIRHRNGLITDVLVHVEPRKTAARSS
ncbi:MAG: cation diffusion facilitator family transporter [Chthoniobacterales bacterium]